MVEQGTERRLAAIVAIDVVGYSRLMGADEEGTLATLRAHQDAVRPLVQDHGGRLVGTAGDGLLLEFPSVVEAVACTIKVQAMMAARNADIAVDKQMLFRIGINLGDVLATEDGDIFGDGVNVAARIEALAQPGGICMSRSARDQVRDRLDIALEDMGEIEVKNIARPVRVFRVLADGEAPPQALVTATPRPLRQSLAMVAGLLLLVLIAGGTWWWLQQQPDFEPADPKKFAYKLPEKPSIAVLPFDNLTGDKGQDYLGDGLTENIIAVLATAPDLFVIARNSSFTYKGKATKVQDVAAQLGVRYVLEGSVQRDGKTLRITAQLVDAINGRHLWAERYDRDLESVLKLYDEISQKILIAIRVKLTRGESAERVWRNIGDAKTYRIFMRAAEHWRQSTKADNAKAEELLLIALKRRPKSVRLLGTLGATYWQRVILGASKNPARDMARARKIANQALAIDSSNEHPHFLLATLDLYARKHTTAIQHADRALELSPNGGYSIGVAGWVKSWSGQGREATEILKRAMRIEPYHPGWMPLMLALNHAMLGNYAAAGETLHGILESKKKVARTHSIALQHLAAISVFEGSIKAARKHMQRLLDLQPNKNVAAVKRGFAPIKDKEFVARYLAALRKAGLPEYAPGKGPKAKPSIAVLPFANISGDKEQEYFADGMTEDLITDLSKISGLLVIARNSVFTYKGKNVKVQEIAKDLNVTHIVEGSVRKVGGKVRINAQLIDAKTGTHLWAEKYTRELKDVFALQDEIVEKISAALKVKLTGQEKAHQQAGHTSNSAAHDAYLRGWSSFRQRTPAEYKRAMAWFEKAVAIDPDYGGAWAALASLHLEASQRGWVPALGLSWKNNNTRLKHALTRALKKPTALAYLVKGEILIDRKERFEEADVEFKRAIVLEPNNPDIYVIQSTVLANRGRFEDAIALIEKSMRLDPFYPAFNSYILAQHYFAKRDFAKAVELLTHAHARNPKDWLHLPWLAAAYAHLNKIDQARKTGEELKANWPKNYGTFTAKTVAWMISRPRLSQISANLANGLLRAGVPDIPAGFNFTSNDQLSVTELRQHMLNSDRKGRFAGGVWKNVTGKDGMTTSYFNKVQTYKGRFVVFEKYRARCRENDDIFQSKTCCQIYKNPGGTSENLDQYVAVCNHGVYPHARYSQTSK